MKLVVDNSIVVELDEYANIAAMARKFADDIDSGKYEGLRTASLLTEQDGQVSVVHWGYCPTRIEGIGMMELAKAAFAYEAFNDEE